MAGKLQKAQKGPRMEDPKNLTKRRKGEDSERAEPDGGAKRLRGGG